MDRDAHVFWEAKGSKSMESRVRERLDDILKNHTATPLDPETTQSIENILTNAEKRYT